MLKTLITYKNKAVRKYRKQHLRKTSHKAQYTRGQEMVSHPKHLHTFCGYYDRSPFSPDGKCLLVLCTDVDQLEAEQGDAYVYIYNLKDKTFTQLAQTSSWNFQQGAQQQWTADGNVILNTERGGEVVAQIYKPNAENTVLAEIPSSIGMVSRSRGLVVSYEYGPMNTYEPDYGYKVLQTKESFADSLDHLKITIWSLEKKSPLQVLSPERLDKLDLNDPGSNQGTRYIQHAKFNPSGTKLMFVLRSAHPTRKVAWSSLHAWDLETDSLTNLILTKDWLKGCNHPVWANDKEVLVNLVDDRYKARKFILIDSSTGQRKIIAPSYDGVGHPTICEEGAFILTDEYTGAACQILTQYPLPSGRRRILGHFDPSKYPRGANRCDLHPRYDKTTKLIAIDHYDGEGRVVSLVSP